MKSMILQTFSMSFSACVGFVCVCFVGFFFLGGGDFVCLFVWGFFGATFAFFLSLFAG